MANLDAQVKESQAQVAEAQSKIAELTSRIETARAKLKAGDDIEIDIENATLEDVHNHTEVMNANIAELIMGLDDVTSAFSKDFDEMRDKTGWESFVGVFSRAKSESMRQDRIRTASIDDKLQDLIAKSDVITRLLEDQLAVLNEQKSRVETNLAETLDEREVTVGALETVRAEILTMDPRIIALENKIAVEQDAAARTKLESELAELNAGYNALVQDEQVKLAKSQTLERYIEKGKTWIDSLQNQAATQMVLINKLQTDTKQRVVLYDALTKSLKTAQQQVIQRFAFHAIEKRILQTGRAIFIPEKQAPRHLGMNDVPTEGIEYLNPSIDLKTLLMIGRQILYRYRSLPVVPLPSRPSINPGFLTKQIARRHHDRD